MYERLIFLCRKLCSVVLDKDEVFCIILSLRCQRTCQVSLATHLRILAPRTPAETSHKSAHPPFTFVRCCASWIHYIHPSIHAPSLYWKCFVELIRRSQANNRRAVSYATQKLSATHAYARSLYAIRCGQIFLAVYIPRWRALREKGLEKKRREPAV